MPKIGIIAGVRGEAEALSPIFSSPDAPYVRLSGARPAIAESQINELIKLGVDGVLSFGSCGGVEEGLAAGALIVASAVQTVDGTSYATDKDWTLAISQSLGVEPKAMLGSDKMLSVADKQLLAEECNVVAVDMESHIAARLAQEAGIPFAVLRAVVDPMDFNIPNWVLDGVRPDGSTSLLPIVAGACLQPWTLGRLLTLQSYNKAAIEALGGAVRTIGPGLGLGGLTL